MNTQTLVRRLSVSSSVHHPFFGSSQPSRGLGVKELRSGVFKRADLFGTVFTRLPKIMLKLLFCLQKKNLFQKLLYRLSSLNHQKGFFCAC